MKNETGIKYDANKPLLAEMILDFKEPLIGLCKVWEFGKDRYGKSNWKKLENGKDRYLNAFYRHSIKMVDNPIDSESGLPHYYHMLFNAMAYAYFCEKENKSVINPIAKAYSDLVTAISKVQHSNPNNN